MGQVSAAAAVAKIAGWLLLAAIIAGADPTAFLRPPDYAVTGTVEEDSPAWDCRTMGNEVCGPHNAQGLPAGYYGGQK